MNAVNDSICVLQITDTHLFSQPSGRLLGLNTRDSFAAVVRTALRYNHQPDFILATGDLAQEPSVQAYQALEEGFSQFNCPVYCLFGNHDDRDYFSRYIKNEQIQAVPAIAVNPWRFIMLDSQVEGAVHGFLSQAQLCFLDGYLSANRGCHTTICLHHQPVPIGCQWLDALGLQNAEQFFAIVDKYDQVRVVLWGHVHQDFQTERKEVSLFACPSTSIQFKPKSVSFACDDALAPGYRLWRFYPDGRFDTYVYRATDFQFELEYDETGYE